MAHHTTLFLLAAIALLMHGNLHAKDSDNETCPKSIETTQSASGAPVEGWSAFGTRESAPLTNVSFFAGPPDQKGLLAPTRESRKGGKPVATWDLPAASTDYWVACEYAKTTVVVAKRLGPEPRLCSVECDPAFSAPVAKRWRCRRPGS